jgi:hypothetical protein
MDATLETPDLVMARHLAPNEHLLWSGRPRQGFRLRPMDLLFVPFSFMWGGFAVFWEYSVIRSNGPFLFRLWGIPFVLAGLYIIFGRFFVDARLRSQTFYGLTNERVIIVSGWGGKKVTSVSLRTANNISFHEGRNGSGTILFFAEPMAMHYSNQAWPGMPQLPMLDGIDQARTVYDLINGAQAGVR